VTSKRDRLQAAIAGEVADRLPVALWRHFPVDDQDSQALAEATLAFQREFDFDFIKVTPASSFCLRDWGAQDTWEGATEGTRRYTRRVVREPEDWVRLPLLTAEAPSIAQQLDCLRRVVSGAGPETPVVQTVFSPLAQAKNLAGEGRLFDHLHRAPDLVLRGLQTISASTLAFAEAARESGIAGVFYALQHASFRYFDRAGYQRFGEGFDRPLLEAASDLWCNVLHLHGDAVMFDVAEGYPVQIVNWHDRETPPSLAEGRSRLRAAVCGGLRREETMVLGEPGTVRAEAAEAIGQVGGRGLVLGTGCVTPIHAPRGNLVAARTSVEECA
jgi:uroporphyrinogen decarboxylase